LQNYHIFNISELSNITEEDVHNVCRETTRCSMEIALENAIQDAMSVTSILLSRVQHSSQYSNLFHILLFLSVLLSFFKGSSRFFDS
jgi:hypothetical protein